MPVLAVFQAKQAFPWNSYKAVHSTFRGGVPAVPAVPGKKILSCEEKNFYWPAGGESREKSLTRENGPEHLERRNAAPKAFAHKCLAVPAMSEKTWNTDGTPLGDSMSSSYYKPDAQILKDLLIWAEINAPAELRKFYSSDDSKAAARELLRYRIGQEDWFAYELSDALIVKLGGEVDHVFDETEKSLAAATHARLERRIR